MYLAFHPISLACTFTQKIFTFHKRIPFGRWSVISNATGSGFGLVEAEKRKGDRKRYDYIHQSDIISIHLSKTKLTTSILVKSKDFEAKYKIKRKGKIH